MGVFVVVQALWLFLPAYMANMAPVFAAKVVPRWNARIDGGRVWSDGRPVLGSGKTWRGLWAGAFLGAATAAVQSLARHTRLDLADFAFAEAGWAGPVVLGFALGLGALVGDTAKSFFKRRRDRPQGAPWVPFDQLDFVVGGLLLAAAAAAFLRGAGLTAENWFAAEFLGPRWPVLAILLLATPVLHYVVNVIGYKLKFKQVPW